MLYDKCILRLLNKIRRKGMTVDEGLRFIVADQSCSFSEKQTARAILNDPSAFDRFLESDGGKGSGNFGHKGRPGQRGGSGAGGGGSKAPKGLSFEQQKARWGAMSPKQYSEMKLAEFPDGVNPEVRAVFEKAAKSEPAITDAMQRHAQACGAEMDGLEFRMKDGDSFMRKVRKDAQEHGHQGQLKAAGKLYDAVRYTQVSDEKNLVANAKKTLTNLKAEGYNVVGVKNTWKDPNTAYNGINVKLRSPDGQQFELQFHTRDSLRVKEQIHTLYEEQRKLSTRDPRYKELNDQMMAISSGQRRPDSIETL